MRAGEHLRGAPNREEESQHEAPSSLGAALLAAYCAAAAENNSKYCDRRVATSQGVAVNERHPARPRPDDPQRRCLRPTTKLRWACASPRNTVAIPSRTMSMAPHQTRICLTQRTAALKSRSANALCPIPRRRAKPSLLVCPYDPPKPPKSLAPDTIPDHVLEGLLQGALGPNADTLPRYPAIGPVA